MKRAIRRAAEFNKQQKILQQSLEQGRFGEGAAAVAEYERKLLLLTRATIDYAGANDNLARGAEKITNQFGLQRHQVQNLTAQFVDFGVQLSSGGGILLPLIQQGPQAIDAVGGLGKAMELVRSRFAALSTVSKGLLIGGAGVTIFGLLAKQAVDLSRALAEMTQPERLNDALQRVEQSTKELANEFDLFAGRPSDIFINALNTAAESASNLTKWLRETRVAQEQLNQAASRSVPQQMVPGPPPVTGMQGIYTQQSALDREYGGKAFNLPSAVIPSLPGSISGRQSIYESEQLRGTLGAGGALGTEGRKELIDGVTKGFEQVMSGIDHEIKSMSGDVRVWGRKLDENTQSARDGLSSVETAVYDVSGTVSRWGLVSKEAIDTLTQATIAAAQARYGAFAGPTGGFDSDAAFEAAWLEFFGTPLSGTTKGTGGSSTTGGTITARYSEDPNSLRSRFNRGVATARSGGVPYAGETMTAAASGTSTISDMTSPISREIDALRSLQEAVMQREYRPDPYSDKNPDVFYGAGRQFRAEQDKQFNALQDQIDQLQSIQGLTATLVNQGASLPQMLVNALLAAGFGNLAAEISAGIARSITTGTTTTTTGTAQMGPLANRYGSTSFRANIV